MSFINKTIRITPDDATEIEPIGDDLYEVNEALYEKDDDALPEVIEQLFGIISQRERREGVCNQKVRRKLTDASIAYDEDRPRAAWNRVVDVYRSLS